MGEEIGSLTDQLTVIDKNAHEMQKQKSTMEGERNEMAIALEEAEKKLESSESRVEKLSNDFNSAKRETERRVTEKENEIDTLRKNSQRAIESMQTTLDVEIKTKAEALRGKKKLEADLADLQMQLMHANRGCAESSKQHKISHSHYREMIQKHEQSQKKNEDLQEQMGIIERRSNLLTTNIEEKLKKEHSVCQHMEKAKKVLESQVRELQ